MSNFLEGFGSYEMLCENNFEFKVIMTSCGKMTLLRIFRYRKYY